MKILFLGLGNYKSINDRGIYIDLLRTFVRKGHEVFIVSALEPDSKEPYQMVEEANSHILKVKTGRITKTNVIEKGINTVLIEGRYIRAIKKHYGDVRFDLVLYPTPPITFLNVVSFIKKRDDAASFLMLKDIFPQNAVDIGMMKTSGIAGVLYRYFREKEKRLYEISDYIGCMSEANLEYVLKNNPGIPKERLLVFPNSVEAEDKSVDEETRSILRKKYEIPLDKTVFLYGGNLGKPQGIPFLLKCLESAANEPDAYFLIIGAGTEYAKIEDFIRTKELNNVKLLKRLPKNDYESMVGACDVGLIFLDYRFTIPNFPSRLLSYLQAKIPVLAATDPNTDVGRIACREGFGWWCESNNVDGFRQTVEKALHADRKAMGERGYSYLMQNYTVEKGCQTILDTLKVK